MLMHDAPLAGKLTIFLVMLVGCGGSEAKNDASAQEGMAIDASATPHGDARADVGGPSDSGSEAPSPISWDGRVPMDHRASSSTCPQQRAAGTVLNVGFPCPDGGLPSPTAFACAQDSDCTMGNNGRCLSAPIYVYPEDSGIGPGLLYCETLCSYDQCFSDSDCAARVPCACRYQPVYGEANLCLTEGNCAVDSDCGPGGFCSPSVVMGGSPEGYGYFCHTPNDLCIDNMDCGPDGSTSSCQFDVAGGHWACHTPPPFM